MPEEKQSSIVANGGWVEANQRDRPKKATYAILSVLWVFPSFGALWILIGGGAPWFGEPSLAEGLSAVKFEEWIAIGLLLLHAVFVALAIHNARREPIRDKRASIPNPDVDLRKLY